MKQVIQQVRSGKLGVQDVPEPHPRRGGIVVRNAASLISAGTEKMLIDFAGKSMLGKARERPDLVRQVIGKVRAEGLGPTVGAVMSRLDQPLALGYSCAGVVQDVGEGAGEFAAGDRVACAGMGYASHAHAVFVPRNLAVKVPDGVSLEDASYVTLGAISLHGVRVADLRLGENVAVVGLGLLGQLTVQILRASGCRVLGVDLDPAKVQLALELGAEAAVPRGGEVAAAVAAFTGGVGVDAVLVTAATDSNDPIELAAEICRDRGRVTVVGAVSMQVPRKPFYEKELDLRLSRSYGPGRYDPEYEEGGRDYPIGYVRWTERRNMEEFLRLIATGAVTPSRLTSHRFSIDEAETAYALIKGNGEPFLGVVLTYPELPDAQRVRTVALSKAARRGSGAVGLAFIGAGNFARSVLLPRLAKDPNARLVGVSTATGASAVATGEKFGFGYATTDSARVLEDPDVDAVFIATRHGSHAALAARALRAGKSVFVEKPLALDAAGLEDVLAAQREGGGVLGVGFNRRFSRLAQGLREPFRGAGPLAVSYRVNAGAIPAGTWVHDPQDGGGRIIGEGGHFVDFASFLTGAVPVEVFAYGLGGHTAGQHDTVAIVLKMEDGSVATLQYFSTGDRSFGKERVEVYGGGSVAVLDDFRELTVSAGGRRSRTRTASQDKGFDAELSAFLTAVREGGPDPIPVHQLEATHRATFAIEASLRTGVPVAVGR